jgi:NAD(P)H-nitrite reductase large subunit
LKYDYVIIGNSAGGIGCAEAIREVDRESSLAIISAEKYRTYSRALIPYYLDGRIDEEKMYYRPEDFYEKIDAEAHLGVKVERVNVDSKEVELESGEKLGFNKLLIATGGKPFIPPMEGLKNQKNAFTFLSFDDVLRVKEACENSDKVVVLGGGIIGLMVAEVLSRKGLEVKVVELLERVLAPVVDETVSRIVQRKFEENGVEMILGDTISKVSGEEEIQSVTLRSGRKIETDMLVIAVGVIPNVDVVKGTSIKINRGIVVNRKMETSAKDIYACGDCAEVYDSILGSYRVLPLWPIAYSGGRVAGFNMCGVERELIFATAMNAMHFFDYYIITGGLNLRDGERDFEVISEIEGENYRKVVLKDGEILGFIVGGEVRRAGILMKLMREKLNVSSFKESLVKSSFGFLDIPKEFRWELLGDKVKIGVVREV